VRLPGPLDHYANLHGVAPWVHQWLGAGYSLKTALNFKHTNVEYTPFPCSFYGKPQVFFGWAGINCTGGKLGVGLSAAAVPCTMNSSFYSERFDAIAATSKKLGVGVRQVSVRGSRCDADITTEIFRTNSRVARRVCVSDSRSCSHVPHAGVPRGKVSVWGMRDGTNANNCYSVIWPFLEAWLAGN
jgi:hypothetical protein